MSQKIKKAVITAAGYGTRLLPATKNVPKEMLPILNKPMIHYVVEQFMEAEIKDLVIVVDEGNSAVKDYFRIDQHLVDHLNKKGKLHFIEEIQKICDTVKFTFVNQDKNLPYGNARPIYSAKHLVEDEPFIYKYGDDMMFGRGAGVIELVEHFTKHPSDVVLTGTKVTPQQMTKFGMIRFENGHQKVVGSVVEKPKLEQVDSEYATVSSYVFTPALFDHLNPKDNKGSDEFQIQPAINELIKNGTVTACISQGKFLTNGDVTSYLELIIEEALTREDTRDEFFNILQEKIESLE